MAREMPEKQVEVYRTVVRLTYLEDGPVGSYWDGDKGYEKRPQWYAGQVKTEVYGPYANKSVNQDYGSNTGWHYQYNEETFKREYTNFADVKVEKQVLKPVLALNEHGALELALDWVRYK